jgi:adenine-specific DNA-methyltransferase
MEVLSGLDVYSNTPEKEYSATVSLEHRKRFAQFFTPYPLAKFMADWITNNPKCKTILDPALGLGIFVRAILEDSNGKPYCIKGYETDNVILEKARLLIDDDETILLNKDYMFNDWGNKYDGIIANPPYLKFHDYSHKDEILKEFHSRLGLTLTGFTNIYTLFLLKSIHQLNQNGRAAYLIPSEFLNSDYGKNVKKYLIKNKSLKYIIIFDFNEKVFDDVLTTASIFLFENDSKNTSVKFITIKSTAELNELSGKIKLNLNFDKADKSVNFSDLDPNIKWRGYYQTQNGKAYKNLVPLSMYGKVVRGIATGDNDYFTFNRSKQKEFGIDDRFLLPCISKSLQANTHFFTQSDFETAVQKDQKVFLFNGTDLKNENVKAYIGLGEKLGVNQKFLTSHRTPWYALENRPPSPIWVNVFNRNGLRFVRNEAEVRNLTTFHCLYLNMFAQNRADLFFAYLLTDVSRDVFRDNRREYGEGLEKFEPNDLNNSQVVNLDLITKGEEEEIICAYKLYESTMIAGRTDTSCIEILNKVFTKILNK